MLYIHYFYQTISCLTGSFHTLSCTFTPVLTVTCMRKPIIWVPINMPICTGNQTNVHEYQPTRSTSKYDWHTEFFAAIHFGIIEQVILDLFVYVIVYMDRKEI